MSGASPRSLAEVSALRAARPDQPLWKPLGEFLDAFYEADDRAAMLQQPPSHPICRREAAYLAASAEYLSGVYGIERPAWVDEDRYFLEVAFWPDVHGRASEVIFLAESPTPFRRRFIFTEARPLRRKGGPRFTAASGLF